MRAPSMTAYTVAKWWKISEGLLTYKLTKLFFLVYNTDYPLDYIQNIRQRLPGSSFFVQFPFIEIQQGPFLLASSKFYRKDLGGVMVENIVPEFLFGDVKDAQTLN
jgi:hypothetical protein